MNIFSDVPPGFRFHPTDEELVDYYLRKKITSTRIDLDVIKEVDLYKIEPWDLQEICRTGRSEEHKEWYFFSHKDKKYPTGTRTNRATAAGFWKATGRDKAVYCKHELIGMRKTLVFYRGRAPNGEKSDWIMHEYRLQTHHHHHSTASLQEEGWVVCRVFKKRITTIMGKVMTTDHDSLCWYEDDQVPYMSSDSPNQQIITTTSSSSNPNFLYHLSNNNYVPCKKEVLDFTQYLHLPLFATPELLRTSTPYGLGIQTNTLPASSVLECAHPKLANVHGTGDPVTDWRLLDKFVASQLSQEEGPSSSAAGNSGFHWVEAGSSVRNQEAGDRQVAGKSADPALD